MELRNYRKFRQAAMEFPDGVIGILGRNGVGKSSLVEAIAWALYGNESSIVRTSKDSVRYAGAGPSDDCSVLLLFEMNGDEHRLLRTMKGKNLSMDASLSINNRLEASGDKGVTEAVEKRLGMDYKAFFISVFARQKELAALSDLNPSERKNLVLRMLGIDALTEIISMIDSDGNLAKAELSTLQRMLVTPEGKNRRELIAQEVSRLGSEGQRIREEMEAAFAEATQATAGAEKARARRDELARLDEAYQGLNRKLITKRTEIGNLTERCQQLEKEIKSLSEKREEVTALSPLMARYDSLIQIKEELEGRMRIFEERRALLSRLASIEGDIESNRVSGAEKEAKVSELEGSREHLEKVEANLQELRCARDAIIEEAKYLEQDAKRLEREAAQTRAKMEDISRLGPESSCPTCERKLCDQHSFLMQKLASEVEERSRQIAELRTKRAEKTAEASQRTKRMEALELRRTGLKERRDQEIRLRQTICEMSSGRTRLMEEKERLDAKLRSLGEVPFDDVQYQQVRKESTELKPKVDRAKQMMVQVERVPVLEEELGRVSETLSRAEKERQDIESSMTQLGYKEGDLKAAQSLLDQAMGAKEQKTATLTRHEREFAGLEKEVHLRQESLVELEAKEKEWGVASKRLQEQTVLSQVMKDFRKNLISRIVPTLSELSSRLFQDLTESKFGGLEIDEDYRIYIYDKGEKYPLSRFSGGESDLANLCLRLAISRVIAERAGSAVNFLILDEIFGSQDQARKRNILEAFNQLSKQFRQIFLITHIEDVKEFMGNAIMVLEAEDGSGRIEVSA